MKGGGRGWGMNDFPREGVELPNPLVLTLLATSAKASRNKHRCLTVS